MENGVERNKERFNCSTHSRTKKDKIVLTNRTIVQRSMDKGDLLQCVSS